MKLDLNKEMNSWLIVLNNNAKWSVAITIRFLLVFSLIIIFILLLKWTGIISELKGLTAKEATFTHQEKVVIVSKPTAPTHKSDIQKTTDLQKLITDKIKKKRSDVLI